MNDILLTVGAVWLGALAIAAVLVLTRAAKLSLAWLLVAIVIFGLNSLALFYLSDFVPVEAVFGDLDWNWGGKIAAVIVSLLVILALWLVAKRPLSATGFSLRQSPGSIGPALMAAALIVALSVGLQIWADDGTNTDAERLLYQGTMPGLDEELFWRGTLLLALSEALRGGRWNLFGARIGWGGAVMTLMFGALHGFAVQQGQWLVDPASIAITATVGFGLLWIRERTGSVLVPIITHNLVNVAISFV